MSFYTGLRATADKLLAKYGQPMTLTDPTPGAYNPSTATAGTTPTTYACRGAVFDIKGQEFEPAMVLAGDRKVILSAQGLSVTPAPSMTLTFDGEAWAIVNRKTVNPGAVAVVHELQVRK